MRSKVKLEIVGRNSDYFLSLLIEKKINILYVEKKYKRLIIIVDYDDYKRILRIKTSYKINIIGNYGLLRIRYLFKQYLSFIISFIVCVIFIIFISNLIFVIDVNSSNTQLKKMVIDDLKVRGVSKYKLKPNFVEKNKIIKEILEEEKDYIDWLEIDSYGTKININVVERKKNNNKMKCVPSNIVAKKDAFVKKIHAVSGEVLTAINRSVKKGDILISGNIYNKEDIVSSRCANGTVYGEVWYQVLIELPKHYHEENVTGKSSKRIGFEFFNLKNKPNYQTYKSKKVYIYKHNYLPISISYINYLETKVSDITFDINNIDSYAYSIAYKKISNKLGKNDYVLSKKILKKEEKESKIIVGVFFKVFEDISEYQEIIKTGE